MSKQIDKAKDIAEKYCSNEKMSLSILENRRKEFATDIQTFAEEYHREKSKWISCESSNPKDFEEVLITNGKEVWIGDYSSNRSEHGAWAIVWNGAPPFSSKDVIAWKPKPDVP